jgi:LmbE family N-acetylglucosaminyl deacetylase
MRILVISPHTDDESLGCGGSIARWVEEGHEVECLALSTGRAGKGATVDEFEAALRKLGVKEWHYRFFPSCRFHEYRQDIIDYFFEGFVEFYDLVLTPSTANVHQDHEVVTAEVIRAFRTCSILGYEMPWGDVRPFHPQLYVKLTLEHTAKKIAALECYESQEHRAYMDYEMIVSQFNLRGMQVGADHAEAFEVIRWVM